MLRRVVLWCGEPWTPRWWRRAAVAGTPVALIAMTATLWGPEAAIALIIFVGAVIDETRWRWGATPDRWAHLIGRQTRDLIATRRELEAPDGRRPEVSDFERRADGLAGEVWTGSDWAALEKYCDSGLVQDLNRRNAARISTRPERWRTEVARVQPDRRVPGRGSLVVLRRHPIRQLQPWPYEPGWTPMQSPFGVMDLGRAAWGGDLRLPLWGGESHLLGAGTTGSGKSGGAHAILSNVLPLNLWPCGPQVAVVGIDCKGGVEFGDWAPAMSAYATSPAAAVPILDRLLWWVGPDGPVVDTLAKVGRRAVTLDLITPDLPAVLVIIDELAEVVRDKDAAARLASLAALSRFAAVRIVAFTQYPLADLIGATLGVNLSARLCWRIGTRIQGAVALDHHPDLTDGYGPHAVPEGDPEWAGAVFASVAGSLTLAKTLWVDDATLRANSAACAAAPKPRTPWLDTPPPPTAGEKPPRPPRTKRAPRNKTTGQPGGDPPAEG